MILVEIDNDKLVDIIGSDDRYLHIIEEELGATLTLRGNRITIMGSNSQQENARNVLKFLEKQRDEGRNITEDLVDLAIRHTRQAAMQTDIPSIITKRRTILARSPKQGEYIRAMQTCDLVLSVGPAGTGKTYLAAAMGVSMLLSGAVDRIILTRPAVEAGEHLGFLPGDMKEKVDPYLRPLYDALHDALPADQVMKRISMGEIEIAPLAFMRGRTLKRAFVILDEAQNTTSVQMKMFLTRIGPHSRMVVTGDVTQVDLPKGVTSGLSEAAEVLKNVEGVETIYFDDKDIVRHPLVGRIVKAYEERSKKD